MSWAICKIAVFNLANELLTAGEETPKKAAEIIFSLLDYSYCFDCYMYACLSIKGKSALISNTHQIGYSCSFQTVVVTSISLGTLTKTWIVFMFQGDEKAWKSGGDMCDPDKEV